MGGPRIVRLLLLAVCISSCCAGSCPDDLLLLGAQPTNISGSGGDSTAIVEALEALMTQRIYDSGAYINWCCSPHDASKLTSGEVRTYVAATADPAVVGTAARLNYRYILTFTMPEGVLTVDCDFNAAQRVINDIKGERAESPSTRTALADCTFVGQLAGQPVNLAFQQELRGTKRSGIGGFE
jgi:hypothetical protein